MLLAEDTEQEEIIKGCFVHRINSVEKERLAMLERLGVG